MDRFPSPFEKLLGAMDAHWSRKTRGLALCFGFLAFLVSGRLISGVLRSEKPELMAGTGAPALSMAGRSRLGSSRAIRSGFTNVAQDALHELTRAFEARRVDVFASLVDVDYELDYHRMLHDLESQFQRSDQIQLSMNLLSVEPLPAGFVAEVRWQKTFRVKRTGHRVHEEGQSHLFFGDGSPPRLRTIRGEMPF